MKNAMAWAEAKGLSRTNPVHQQLEYRVPTDFSFSHKDTDRSSTKVQGDSVMKARPLHIVPQEKLTSSQLIHALCTLAGCQRVAGGRWL